MEIKTKYEIYQDVYFMRNNQIVTDEIKEIIINIIVKNGLADKCATLIKYTALNNFHTNAVDTIYLKEKELFGTKQDLLNSL